MSIVIPIVYKLKVRKLTRRKKESLHLYVMLKQRKSWFNLESTNHDMQHQ